MRINPITLLQFLLSDLGLYYVLFSSVDDVLAVVAVGVQREVLFSEEVGSVVFGGVVGDVTDVEVGCPSTSDGGDEVRVGNDRTGLAVGSEEVLELVDAGAFDLVHPSLDCVLK